LGQIILSCFEIVETVATKLEVDLIELQAESCTRPLRAAVTERSDDSDHDFGFNFVKNVQESEGQYAGRKRKNADAARIRLKDNQ